MTIEAKNPIQEQAVLVSIVTPVYSGESYLASLVKEIGAVRDRLQAEASPWQIHEVVFVCDDPVDGSAQVLEQIQSDPENAWVQVITLSQNYGQHLATIAGVLHASGDWVATLDEDLQHHPLYIEQLLRQAVVSGSDIAYGKPEGAVHESWFRDLSSRYYKRMVSILAGDPNVVHFNSFRVMRGSVARAAASIATHDTYYDIALGWYTDKVSHLVLPLKDTRYIRTSKSGYSLRRLVSHARRMFANSQVKILRGGALVGAFTILLASVMAVIFLGLWVFNYDLIAVRGWLSTFLVILFFGGLNALLIGFALEQLSIILFKAQGKPSFFIVDRSRDARLRDYFDSRPIQEPHADRGEQATA